MPELGRISEHKPSSRWDSFGKQLLGTAQSILGALAASMVFLLIGGVVHVPFGMIFSLVAVAGIGLVAGLYVRLILRKSLEVIQFLAGFAATLTGILAFNLALTQIGLDSGFVGFPRWVIFAQVFLAGISVWLVQTAWRKDHLKLLKKKAQLRRSRREKLLKMKANARGKSHRISKTSRVPPNRQSHQKLHPVVRRPQPSSGLAVATRTENRKRKSRKVTLSGFEEHRCPYCLQEVKVNDPRGVKVCSVCGAWHHKDCWDITGHCQVPHSGNAHA